MRETWTTPTRPRKKFTDASLFCDEPHSCRWEGKWGNDIHDIPRLNDQAPAGPDQTCACEGDVLGEGELFGGPVEVGDAGKDEAPLL